MSFPANAFANLTKDSSRFKKEKLVSKNLAHESKTPPHFDRTFEGTCNARDDFLVVIVQLSLGATIHFLVL
jgi:hypothetical protein